MKKLLLILFLIPFISCTQAQVDQEKQHLAICKENEGCKFSEITLSPNLVDQLLGKTNYWTSAGPKATLVIEECDSQIEESFSLEEIDRKYGGKGENIHLEKLDLEKHLKENGCFVVDCANETKKISFQIQSAEISGNGYYYLNIKAGEAFMPNASFQQLLKQEDMGNVILDQFVRNEKLENYVITEGQKYHVVYPVNMSITKAIKNDAINAERFKKDFKKTGNTRTFKSNGLMETEYVGVDDEGNALTIWMVPLTDICLPEGKFGATGFYNVGYIAVEGKTHLITEMSVEGFMIKVLDITNDTYTFNPSGYQTMNMPGF